MYISYGMTWKQFWYGDPWMVKDYRDAYILKRRTENENLWLQGAYIYNAFQAVIATAFGKQREKYVEKPFDIFPKTEAEKHQERVNERNRIIRYLNSWLTKSKELDGK